jgi:hypothetical protein
MVLNNWNYLHFFVYNYYTVNHFKDYNLGHFK